jgi:glycosyl transferase family 25
MKSANIIIFIIILVLILLIYLFSIYPFSEHFKNNWYEKIDGIVYINLEKRDDRKRLILNELQKIETDMNRVNKVSGVYIPKNGHKGCVQSHISALNIGKMNRWKYIMIFEDDMELNVSPDEFNNMVNSILEYMTRNKIKWDIIMLATGYNNKIKLNDTDDFIKIKSATTSSGYIVNSHYYTTLIELFTHCNENMSRDKWSGGKDWEPYALDQQWRKLQEKDNWYGFTKDLIKQRNISSSIMGDKD